MAQVWPSALPSPLVRSFNGEQDSQLLRGAARFGIAQNRKRFARPVRMYHVDFLMSSHQYNVFKYFYRVDLNRGSEFFDMDVADGAGSILPSVTRRVRISGAYAASLKSHAIYRVYFDLESFQKSDLDLSGTSLFAPVLPPLSDRDTVFGKSISVLLPQAIGGTSPYTYVVSGLPAGLSFDSSTRIVTGSPTSRVSPTVTYQVTDSNSKSVSCEFVWRITNKAPTADAGPDQSNIAAGAMVTLDGSGSTDDDGSISEYAWIQIAGTGVTLSDATVVMPTLEAPSKDFAQTLRFQLKTTDNEGAVDRDIVEVQVNAQ